MIDAPALKRGLAGGEVGKDVQAIQRAVAAALLAAGDKPKNARNGRYAEQAIADVRAFQGDHGIPATGRVGQPTLDALWPHFDRQGRSLYFRAKIGRAPELAGGRIEAGVNGRRVHALQRMLWRALGDESRNLRNGVYGGGTRDDLEQFLDVADVVGDGATVSSGAWAMLYGFGDAYARTLAGGPTGTTGLEVRSDLVTWAERYVRIGGRYLQARPYQRDVPLDPPLRNDCSGAFAHLMRLAGGPDPSGYGWAGWGNTTTMLEHGERVPLTQGLLKCGDAVFYGGFVGQLPTHVVMMLDSSRLFTFGSTPPTITTLSRYWPNGRRPDLGGRRYLP